MCVCFVAELMSGQMLALLSIQLNEVKTFSKENLILKTVMGY